MSTEQNDSVEPDEDVQGHVFHRPTATDDDVEGHVFHRPTVSAGDDVEGHVFHRPTATDDDVEGHVFHRPTVAADDQDDDVEGHGLNSHSPLLHPPGDRIAIDGCRYRPVERSGLRGRSPGGGRAWLRRC